MELRKIQMTGGSSYTLTLPKRWVETAGLSAGDVVGCTPLADGTLVLHPSGRAERVPRKYDLTVESEPSGHVFRSLIAVYLMGYDAIQVRSKGPLPHGARAAVSDACRRAMGLEVVDEDRTSLTVQDFLDPAEFSMERGLRRMVGLTLSMHTDARDALRRRDARSLKGVTERDDEVDRLYWLVNKQFHALLMDATLGERMGLTAPEALNVLLVARIVERTADHAARIAANALELGEPVSAAMLDRVAETHAKTTTFFQDAVSAFFRREVPAANAVIDAADAFPRAQHALLEEILGLKGERLVHLAYIVESIGRTAAYAADVAETAINQRVAGGGAEGRSARGRGAD